MRLLLRTALATALLLNSACDSMSDSIRNTRAVSAGATGSDSTGAGIVQADNGGGSTVPPTGGDTGSPAVPSANEITDATDASRPPDEDQPPIVRPDAPQALRATRYSATAGELFWAAPADAGNSTRYTIEQDGNVLATVATHSYFTDKLTEGTAYRMSVFALDEQSISSEAAVVNFNSEIDIPPPVYEFDLSVDRPRAAIDEGNAEGSSFKISIAPRGREQVNLSVQPKQPGDGDNVFVELDKDALDRDDPSTTVIFRFPIGMQPILPQSRSFNVVATSGEEVRTAVIVLDVKPTSAPDVYLLIGQSNMVGSSESGAKDLSPGGMDERNDRIWQLNVAPNSNSLFGGPQDFISEASNAIEPRFILAEDPLHDPRNPIVRAKGGTSIGPGLSFAKAALADTTQHIYLVPAAWGATGFCNSIGHELAWNAGSTNNASLGGTGLLERALTRLRMTLRDTGGILRGILWHQGGADSNSQSCADSYAGNLQLMVERLRRDAEQDPRGAQARGSNASIPFIVATQSKGRDDRGDFYHWSATKQQVDGVQRNISRILPFADWVNNDDLVPPAYPCGSSSCVHFGAAASREIGKRYYDALKQVWARRH